MAHIFFGTGWLPDPYDEKDRQYEPRPGLEAKPSRNLRTDADTKDFWESRTEGQKEKEKAAAKTAYQEFKPLVLNQYSLNSCVANAATAAYFYELRRANASLKSPKGTTWFLPSRTFIYYNARQAMEGPMTDDGCYNRDAMKSLHKLGVVPEEALPYPISPQEAGLYVTKPETDLTDMKNSCKTHLQELNADQILDVLKTASERARKAKQSEARKPLDPAKFKEAEGLRSTNEIDKLRNLCFEYVSSLKAGDPDTLLNDAWWDIVTKSAQGKCALYPGVYRYMAARAFRIAKYERLDAKRTWEQQQEWTGRSASKTKNVAAMDHDGEILKENVMKAITDGHPVVFGFTYYAKYPYEQDSKTSPMRVIALKGRHQWPPTDKWGGHTVLAVGYDAQNVTVLNSWGHDWGNAGTFLMPWEYITDFVATRDFWILESFRDASNVDDEDIKDLKKDLFDVSKATVQKQTELKSIQDELVAAKQKLAKFDSTTNTSTKYVAPVVGQALTTDAIEKMKLDDIRQRLYATQKNLFEVEKQIWPLQKELDAVKQKLATLETKRQSEL